MVKVNLTLYGRVQGVFFRAHIKEKADDLKLEGTVCNDEDGTVKVVAQGMKERIDELVEFCISGYENAIIEDVDVEYSDDESEFEGFKIVRSQ